MVSGKKYAQDLEKYDDKEAEVDNHPSRRPKDIADALAKSKGSRSKKPRVKPQKKMSGRGRR